MNFATATADEYFTFGEMTAYIQIALLFLRL